MTAKLSISIQNQRVDFDTLTSIPVPEATRTYQPVAHHVLALMVKTIAMNMLHGYNLHNEQYGIARDGAQMFAVQSFKGETDDMALSIGFRNSLDKSMAIGIALGASVFVCDNLVLSGDITVFRKHTSGMLEDLRSMIINTVYLQRDMFQQVRQDALEMNRIPLKDDDAYRLMGLSFGRRIITPRQLPVMKKEWQHPSL